MGFLDIKITQKRNGQEVAWFKDPIGRRVGTNARLQNNRAAITSAEQMAWLANYYIELQQEQLDAGLGSDGSPMPPLKSNRRKRWSRSQQKWVEYGGTSPEFGYAGDKRRLGLKPIRDLWGPGEKLSYQKAVRRKSGSFLQSFGIGVPAPKTVTLAGGHMRSDIRINYVDDQIAKIAITTQASRIKALANERKAPWWGLSPASSRKFASAQATVYGGAVEDYLDSLGLVQAGDYIVKLARLLNSRKQALRRLAA